MEKSRSQKKRVSIAGMHIDRASAVPIYLQIAAHLRNGILQGALPAGTQFLGSREIARELGCSRTVILTAWDLLYAEGYLESMPRGGVTVAPVNQAQASPVPELSSADSTSTTVETGPVSDRWRSLLAFEYDTNWKSEFSPGAPDVSSFPFKEWARLLRQAWQNPKDSDCLDLPPEGHPVLRREIAQFLGAGCGLGFSTGKVAVTSGPSRALEVF